MITLAAMTWRRLETDLLLIVLVVAVARIGYGVARLVMLDLRGWQDVEPVVHDPPPNCRLIPWRDPHMEPMTITLRHHTIQPYDWRDE